MWCDVSLVANHLILVQTQIVIRTQEFLAEVLPLRDRGTCKNFAPNSIKMTTLLRRMSYLGGSWHSITSASLVVGVIVVLSQQTYSHGRKPKQDVKRMLRLFIQCSLCSRTVLPY